MKSIMQVKSISVIMLSLFFTLMSVSHVADAKRFGGGKSFGYNKQVAPKQFNAPKAAPAKPANSAGAAAGRPASGASKWLGPLAGLAAGGLLAAMLFGDGFDGIQFFDILMFALIAFVLFKLFTRKKQSHTQPQYQSAYEENSSHRQSDTASQQQAFRQTHESAPQSAASSSGSIIGADLEDGVGQGVSQNAQYLSEIPAWFDETGFVDGAKSHFMALQKAWDDVDLSEIESYCTPDLYTALQGELSNVKPGDNHTVVDTLDAEIATMAVDGEYFVVSIRFTGFIQEDAVKGAHAFNEIWHIRRLANDEGNWQVAGIQQANQAV